MTQLANYLKKSFFFLYIQSTERKLNIYVPFKDELQVSNNVNREAKCMIIQNVSKPQTGQINIVQRRNWYQRLHLDITSSLLTICLIIVKFNVLFKTFNKWCCKWSTFKQVAKNAKLNWLQSTLLVSSNINMNDSF